MNSGYIRTILGIFSLWGLSHAAHADIFVYQLPGGARIVTHHPPPAQIPLDLFLEVGRWNRHSQGRAGSSAA